MYNSSSKNKEVKKNVGDFVCVAKSLWAAAKKNTFPNNEKIQKNNYTVYARLFMMIKAKKNTSRNRKEPSLGRRNKIEPVKSE